MNSFEVDVKRFADSRWPSRDLPGRIRKLGEEFGELAEAVAKHQANPEPQTKAFVVEEAADCGIILTDILALLGVSLSDAMEMKLEIVKLRPRKECV